MQRFDPRLQIKTVAVLFVVSCYLMNRSESEWQGDTEDPPILLV